MQNLVHKSRAYDPFVMHLARATAMDLAWINDFLLTFRCPDTHQSLRWALAEDLRRHGLAEGEKALVTQDGARLFSIDDGIPILLPQGQG